MTVLNKFPIGIDDFRKLRKEKFFYIDKTKLIEQLLNSWAEVTLFTRPRRFGKTLNMTMLKSFFETGADPSLFDGLYISHNTKLCEEHLGKYPVIFLSLKSVEGLHFNRAKEEFIELVGREARRFSFLSDSDKLNETDKSIYRSLVQLENGHYVMEDITLIHSLSTLSDLLYKHYERKVIILIDEYDVPLDKAFENGYYKEMVSLLRGFLGNALKSNNSLQFAVLTGCLRISKESIFTGLNNFNVLSIIDKRFDEEFGFTDAEVKELLSCYHLEEKFNEMKEWYDGYHFGEADVYCPWYVMNHVYRLVYEPNTKPQSYWINTSGNSLVKRFIDKSDATMREEIEELIAGNAVEKKIRLDLTYDELDTSMDNIWSVLFMTGYLTYTDIKEDGAYKLVIPNKEVREVFVVQIQEWLRQIIIRNQTSTVKINNGFLEENAEVIEKELTIFLNETISILDTKARNEDKENFYHGILIGILKSNTEWVVKSNIESGDGFADIIIKPEKPDDGIVIELKYSKSMQEMEKVCKQAIQQIKDRRYDTLLKDDGRTNILAYGIAFCKKRCKVVFEKL